MNLRRCVSKVSNSISKSARFETSQESLFEIFLIFLFNSTDPIFRYSNTRSRSHRRIIHTGKERTSAVKHKASLIPWQGVRSEKMKCADPLKFFFKGFAWEGAINYSAHKPPAARMSFSPCWLCSVCSPAAYIYARRVAQVYTYLLRTGARPGDAILQFFNFISLCAQQWRKQLSLQSSVFVFT